MVRAVAERALTRKAIPWSPPPTAKRALDVLAERDDFDLLVPTW